MVLIVYFTSRLDPNPPQNSTSPLRDLAWPNWAAQTAAVANPLLTFGDGATPLHITSDTYREEGIKLLNEIASQDAARAV